MVTILELKLYEEKNSLAENRVVNAIDDLPKEHKDKEDKDSERNEESALERISVQPDFVRRRDMYQGMVPVPEQSQVVDYMKVFYGDEKSSKIRSADEEYIAVDNSPEVREKRVEEIDNSQAEKTMEKMQYAALQGTNQDIGVREREELVQWIMFNKALFNLYQATSITRDVNYN